MYLFYFLTQKVYLRFKILFQTGDINIFALCGVFLVPRYVQLEINQKLPEINAAKY